MSLFLQFWGGIFYLLNKIFFSLMERKDGFPREEKVWRVWSWVVYIIGLPAWFIIFVIERNWIAASLELGGLPSMILGLSIALSGDVRKSPRWLNVVAVICLILGTAYSLYDFGGFTTLNQGLEVALIVGYLFGTYLLAKKRASGYLWFMVMNVACGWLMLIQHYPWLALQQAVSLAFIVDAFVIERRNRK
ncbi:MAG: hypothetical protein Q7S84_02770 [bacterium]|nr:hypothetical protein [bacterium]